MVSLRLDLSCFFYFGFCLTALGMGGRVFAVAKRGRWEAGSCLGFSLTAIGMGGRVFVGRKGGVERLGVVWVLH